MCITVYYARSHHSLPQRLLQRDTQYNLTHCQKTSLCVNIGDQTRLHLVDKKEAFDPFYRIHFFFTNISVIQNYIKNTLDTLKTFTIKTFTFYSTQWLMHLIGYHYGSQSGGCCPPQREKKVYIYISSFYIIIYPNTKQRSKQPFMQMLAW